MSRHWLTDQQWAKWREYLPKTLKSRGRPEADGRKTLNRIIYVFKTVFLGQIKSKNRPFFGSVIDYLWRLEISGG
jgi:hypothetical protein